MASQFGPFYPSSSSRRSYNYDVFLSFRGEDTRKTFTDHFYTALIQTGIYTFRDDNELPRGEEISPQLLKAIEGSRISVVVFSKDYASSRWCLDELAKILECRHRIGQVVLPIFYDVDPSDVRKQTGSYAKAFEAHEERFKGKMEMVNKWREALLEAGNLSGLGLKNEANGYESEFIKKIVSDVACKLGCKSLYVAKHPVGIYSRVQRIISLLRGARNDVAIVGMHGIPGIGKTALARAVFNTLYFEFEAASFVLDVKEIAKKPNGLVELQQRLLHDILKPNVWNISNVYEGMNLIKERLHRKRVLVILDDVDCRDQLDTLMEERSSFGVGSVIIVTTKNEHLLRQLEVDGIYHAKELDPDQSLQLFSWHAFRDTHPVKDFEELSAKVVDYCKGLPLALQILGSHLFKRDKDEWETDITHWQKIPHDDIQGKLKVSFEALNVDTREIFLDIACFFVGRDKEYVANILDARYDFKTEVAFRTLIGASLITFDDSWKGNTLRMHDVLRDMGREIIRQMSPRDPGKRSRIWHHKDAYNVLYQEMGTEVVEGLVLNVRASEAVKLSTTTFTKMRSLQLVEINGLYLSGSFKHVSKFLIWLCWHQCPLQSLEPDFPLDNIVILDMQHSNVKELWKKAKSLNKLKVLNLSYSKHLIKTPNLHSSSLAKLILEGCSSLVEVHQSVGQLKSVVLLNLTGCCSLKILPESMGKMESVTELLGDGTSIKQLPSSMGNLKKLKKLSLRDWNCSEDSSSTSSRFVLSWLPPILLISSWLSPIFRGLRKLHLISNVLCDDTVSVDFGSLSCLQELDLSYNKFLKLPPGIGRLPVLALLKVEDCRNLLSISELPSSLETLKAARCKSLVEIPQSIGHLNRLHNLILTSCYKLKLLPSRIGHTPLQILHVNQCINLQSISELPSSLGFLFAEDCTSLESVLIQSYTCFSLRRCKTLKEIKGMEGVRDLRTASLILEGSCSLLNNFKRSLAHALCNRDMYQIRFEGGSVPEWFRHHEEGHSLSFQVPPATHSQKLVVWVVVTAESHPSGCSRPYIDLSVKTKINGGIALYDRPCFKGFHSSWVKHMVLTNMKGGEHHLELSVDITSLDEEFGEVREWGVYVIEENVIGQGTASPAAPTYYDHLDPWEKYLLQELQSWDIVEVNIG